MLTAILLLALHRRAVTPTPAWNAALAVARRAPQTVGTKTFYSSSSLSAQWSAAGNGVDHYVITATETAGGPPLRFSATGTSTTLTALESSTEYRVTIAACLDASCSSSITSSSSATASTDEEYWQVRGTGNSFATADKIVSDGNTKAYALLYGADAGAALAGKAQLYYDPMSSTEKGVKIGTMNSVSSYTPLSGFGFHRNDAQGKAGLGPLTFQVVALTPRLGAKVRLFYEAEDGNGRARVYSIDSKDGWTGRDFNSSSATICQDSDLTSTCAPTMLIGTSSDGNAHVAQARQLKVGLPTLDKWMWNEEPGTFMVVTIHYSDTSCSSSFFNMGYAVWDGTRWNLQYDSRGCPKTIPGVQAPMPVHVGGARYKLYFNHNATNSGGVEQFKPMKLLYADAAASGSASLVDFDDWETIDRARRVNFFWPNGTLLTDEEKSLFDDYHVWMPSNDPSQQVIYSNMSCPSNGCGAPFIGMGVLLNP